MKNFSLCSYENITFCEHKDQYMIKKVYPLCPHLGWESRHQSTISFFPSCNSFLAQKYLKQCEKTLLVRGAHLSSSSHLTRLGLLNLYHSCLWHVWSSCSTGHLICLITTQTARYNPENPPSTSVIIFLEKEAPLWECPPGLFIFLSLHSHHSFLLHDQRTPPGQDQGTFPDQS